ncbi:MAG: hypothetical protein ACOCRK_07315 [bacterium]
MQITRQAKICQVCEGTGAYHWSERVNLYDSENYSETYTNCDGTGIMIVDEIYVKASYPYSKENLNKKPDYNLISDNETILDKSRTEDWTSKEDIKNKESLKKFFS